MKRRIVLLLCAMLALTGCADTKASDINAQPDYAEEETVECIYTSSIQKEECNLCSKAGKTLLPLYAGQANLGIICINTFDMSPVTINRYDDYGKLIEEKAGNMSMHHNTFGERSMTTSVTAHPDRGYADVYVGFTKDDCIEEQAVESLLCQNCLNAIMEETWDEPYGVGIINFETLEVRLLEENLGGFSFDDYYVHIDRREKKDDSEWTELDLLIFYCPPRYE